MEDKRFQHVLTDPKFRRIPKSERKVKIDNRFQSMFTDKKFQVKYTTDKRGRPVDHSTNEDLKRYYELSSDEKDSSQEESGDEKEEVNENSKYVKIPILDSNDGTDQILAVKGASDSGSADEDRESAKKSAKVNELKLNDKTDKPIPEKIKKKLKNLKVDYARGEGTLLSESSSDDDEETEGELSDSGEIDHKWGELDADAERTDEATCRLAACNMDWDRIRALDLMVLFNSFVPPGGMIKSVVIFPSEFGLQRMKEEEVKGPIELVESKIEEENLEENEEGSKYHMEKLRQYQLNRLKYYYAVVICDSVSTSNKIYTECDGMEYESSATKIDLRFIPDDMTFDHEPKEVCDQLPDLTKYKPRFFTTTALQQAKVDLTWDETDPERVEFAQKLASGIIDEIDDNDLQTYLAVSDSETQSDEEKEKEDMSESDGENGIDKYKALLQEIEGKEQEKKKKQIEMEMIFNPDQKENVEKLVKEKISENKKLTPFELYLEKRKEKRKDKREQKKKKESYEESPEEADSDIPSDIDMNDPYFAEEFNKEEFKPKLKKVNKKHKDFETETEEDKQKQAELELLLWDEEEDGKKHFSLKKIQQQESGDKSKKKRKMKKHKESIKKDDFELNVNDERFSALYTSAAYNIDPTDPQFKKTKNMEKIVHEKLKRRNELQEDVEEIAETKRPKAELNALVKSVKNKTEAFRNKKK